MIGGDFNDIVEDCEKRGGPRRSASTMTDFRSTLDGSLLKDLGGSGYPFTWHNKQVGDNSVETRLNRFCALSSWCSLMSLWHVEHLISSRSDHAPLLLTFGKHIYLYY